LRAEQVNSGRTQGSDALHSTADSSESLRYALLALRNEILRFRFDYPLDIDFAAGPRESLHYYLYSEGLSWSIMSMDATGVPKVRNRLAGLVYKPAYIAWWGLVQLGHFLRHGDAASRDSFLKQVDWLESNAVVRSDGSVVWYNNFDILHGKTLLKSPWISAYDQGLAISAMVRGYRLTKRPHLLKLLRGATQIFAVDVVDGGVREPLPSGVIYSELPGQGIPGIQDGFMTALLGLYDLFVETGDPVTGKLFTDGIEGLRAMLPVWDYRKRWSWYGSRAYLCPPAYHWLNRALLEVLSRLTSDSFLAEYAEAWKTERLTAVQRAEIFAAFLVTKNACRVRNRTWRLNRTKVKAIAASETSNLIQSEERIPM
jgi:D-glucuronyl C5-epimerase C-terminus